MKAYVTVTQQQFDVGVQDPTGDVLTQSVEFGNFIKGKDGYTPFIGENGNWWINTTDTGVHAQGENGTDGQDGVGIESIVLHSTVGKVKIYRITFTDNTTFDYDVTDGNDGTNGDDGKSVEIQNNGTYIQWRLVGDTNWINIVAVADLKGADGTDGTNGTNGTDGEDGKSVELQVSATHIQWRLVGDVTWINLIALSELKGEKGDKGDDGYTPQKGVDYFDGTDGINGIDGRGIVSIILHDTQEKTKTYRITYTDATYTDYDVIDGNDGQDGLTPYIGMNGNWFIGLTDTGVKAAGTDGTNGNDGNGIVSITKTGTVGLIDEYTITFTDTTTFLFYVTNGSNGTNGNDGTDGRGITSIIKTSTVGLVDTYTITYSDSTTSTFNVTNGTNGEMNVIEEVKVNNTPLTVTNKSVNVVVPTQASDINAEPANSNIQSHIGNNDIHVTTTDKSNWNGKQDALGFTPENVANKKTSLTDNSDTYYPSQKAVKTAVDAKQDKNLKFTDTSASSWVADTTYSNYGYKCELSLSGVASTDIAEVIFGHTEAISGNYSPVCLTATDKVTVYSKVNTTITIPTILINKQ